MANLTPLLLDAHLRSASGQSPLEDFWAHDEALAPQVDALFRLGRSVAATDPAWPVDIAKDLGVDLTPRPFFDIVESLYADRWVGVPWVSWDEAQWFFDVSTVASEEFDGLPDGYMFWPVDATGLVLLPTDSDPERAGFDVTSLEPWDENSVRVGAQPVTRSKGSFPDITSSPVRQCHLHIHRQRPNVPHVGMCLEDENDPCDQGCYEVVRTIGGRPIAIDCGCAS